MLRARWLFFLLCSAPAWAQAPNTFLDEDGPARWESGWPEQVAFDAAQLVFHLSWGSGDAPESVPFDDVIRFERARAYEGWPDELFVLLADGRRILISRGTDAQTHAALAPALTELPVRELAPGQGHMVAATDASALPPTVIIGGGPGEGYTVTPIATASVSGLGDASDANTTPVGRKVVQYDTDAHFKGEGGGRLEKNEIDRGVKERMGPIRRCYQRELQRDPGLAGELVVRFAIDRTGGVTEARVRASSLGNAAAEACIVREFGQLSFPKPRGTGSVVVSYPIVFSAG